MTRYFDEIKTRGWTKIENVYSHDVINNIKNEFDKKKHIFYDMQKKKGIDLESKNATHHTIIYCESLFGLLDKNIVDDILMEYFEGKYTLSTIGISEILPGNDVYTQKIHRDVRTFDKNTNLWVNTLVMLDDSTEDNGATWMLEKSHLSPEKPTEEIFFKNSVRATGNAGDVLIFDGNMWHAAGQNLTKKRRAIVTPIYCKPFIKQQLNYAKYFQKKNKYLSEYQKQILGFNALVPESLDQFYQKTENRYYKSDQG